MGVTNRILLYNGCFNPPHRGHLAHLTHAFRHGGPDLALVGAVVLVAGDEYLRWKIRAGSGVLRLDVAKRVRLWNGALGLRGGDYVSEDEDEGGDGEEGEGAANNWCWVLPENSWPCIADDLDRMLEANKFAVEYVRLAGGDKVQVDSVEHGVWECRTILTTDVSRPLGFYDSTFVGEAARAPRHLWNHTEWALAWERPWTDVTAQQSDEEPDDDYTAMPRDGRPAPLGDRDVWTCARLRVPHPSGFRYAVRVVCSVPADRVDPDLSSTRVRAVIAEALAGPLGSGALVDRLRGLALSPELLAKYVTEDLEKEKEEKEEKGEKGKEKGKQPKKGKEKEGNECR
ncbi:hypothetical protein F4781DRAFT_397202 [Annulohypoxylon bovei var. microspora]|nr:hypothetical protein F4781DRAFT_397202 [Annulohypoxylon bovei var. microspora]